MYKTLFLLYLFCLLQTSTPILAGDSDSLIISEVMFNPSKPNNEFIEIYNYGNSFIDISLLKVQYQTYPADGLLNIFGSPSFLRPGGYAVIVEGDFDLEENLYDFSDTTLLLKLDDNAFGSAGMSNSSDRTVIILGIDNDTIDYYTYSADNDAGYSDERVKMDQGNLSEYWENSLSLNGTPGKINSVSVSKPITAQEKKLQISPNPFSPDNDGYEDIATISYKLKSYSSHVRIIIFDAQGRRVRDFPNMEFVPPEVTIKFDGMDNNGDPLRMGIYILYLEAVHENGDTESTKSAFVIARKL